MVSGKFAERSWSWRVAVSATRGGRDRSRHVLQSGTGDFVGLLCVVCVSPAGRWSIRALVLWPEASRLGKIIYAVLLTKTEGKAFSSAMSIAQQGEPELRRGDFCAHGWETWCEKWYAREINGWPM